ncbi:MAG: glycosyltransferase family 4 protein [Sphingobacteriia bacterium]|nr:glycosyltransferase family 4 protein [Sphingobacteriia bacterium]
MRISFFYLTAYSKTGGIEKFNRNLVEALKIANINRKEITAFSLYDLNKSVDGIKFKGFQKKRLSFLVQSFLQGLKSDVIIIGHINLSILIFLLKFFKPNANIILIVHGIEVWNIHSPVQKKAIKLCNSILAVSGFTKNKLIENKLAIDAHKIQIFPNTIESSFLNAEIDSLKIKNQWQLQSTHKILLTIARQSSQEQYKGYDIVLNALPQIKKHINNVKYFLVGKADEAEFNRINLLIDELGIRNEVIQTGFVEEKDLKSYYSMCDVFIMPSKGEGFGIVFLEALACNKKVIAGNGDGSADALLGGELGVLVNPDNEDDVETAIIAALENANDDTELKKQKMLEHFGFDLFVKRLESVLQR